MISLFYPKKKKKKKQMFERFDQFSKQSFSDQTLNSYKALFKKNVQAQGSNKPAAPMQTCFWYWMIR